MTNLNIPHGVECITFPAGERHVKVSEDFLKEIKEKNFLRVDIKSSNDILDLMLLTDILRYRMCQPDNLYIPYMPYSRQDRYTTNNQPFSFRVFSQLINSLNYKCVITVEPHSDVISALISNITIQTSDYHFHKFLSDITTTHGDMILLAPDQGGSKRVDRFNQYLKKQKYGKFDEIGQAIKSRNPLTGKVEITFVTPNVKDKNIVIYDDIVDGGASFIALAEYLQQHSIKYKSLSIFAAHGIFSKGIDCIAKYYTNIGTTDSYYVGNDARVKVYNLSF